jgi:hypothetical protein
MPNKDNSLFPSSNSERQVLSTWTISLGLTYCAESSMSENAYCSFRAFTTSSQ